MKSSHSLACRTPFAEFNHLTLAEVAEFEQLYRARRYADYERAFPPRYRYLLRRRPIGFALPDARTSST